jgi:hypothetical protein
MYPPGNAQASVRSLLACWLAFSGRIIQALTDRVRLAVAQTGSDAVKDGILDLDNDEPGTGNDLTQAPPLPPLDAELLRVRLQSKVDQVLRAAAETINSDPSGCWAQVTEERIQDLFDELGREVLEQALELRVTAAEDLVPSQQFAPGQWAHKFRVMLAAEGRWPTEKDLTCN